MELPDRRPDDLKLHFRVGSDEVLLGAGEEAMVGGFILRAEQVHWDIEWHRSSAAVARVSERIAPAALRESSALMASDHIDLSRTG